MTSHLIDPQTDPQRGLSRRLFLQRATTAGLGVSALFSGLLTSPDKALAIPVFPGFGDTCPRFGVFDDHTFATLVAIAEQIVPTDEDPGNTDLCGASLVEAISAGDANTATLISNGIAALDQSSTILFNQVFRNLAFDDQTTVLQQIEAGTAPGNAWQGGSLIANPQQADQPISGEMQTYLQRLQDYVPVKPQLIGAHTKRAGNTAQQLVFGTLRTLCKLAFVLNFPETEVRHPDGTPIFADPVHLISDPDDPETRTGWTIVSFHEIDYEVEKLLWEWQSGLRVIGFNGVPILDEDNPLSESERLAARDALYALSDQGLA